MGFFKRDNVQDRASHPAVRPLLADTVQPESRDALLTIDSADPIGDRTFTAPPGAHTAEITIFSGELVAESRPADDPGSQDVGIGSRFLGGVKSPNFVQVPANGGKIILNAVNGSVIGGTADISLNWLG